MERIVIDIEKNNLLGMLSEYYSNLNGKPTKIKSKVETGEGCCGYMVTNYYFYYEELVKIYNHDVKQTFYLSEEEVKEALKEMLKRDGYSVSSVTFKSEKKNHESYLYEWSKEELTEAEITLLKEERKLKLVR